VTTHQLYLRHAPGLGIDSYGTFCRLLELLDAPAQVEEYPGGCTFYGPPLRFDTLHEALAGMRERIAAPNQQRVRVSLLDGTVVREWPEDEWDGIF
jgi:hypothetical protein